ncbi:MAG TPA: hypothetical protein ENJ60_09035 [Aeromonadales bacterium]|nr:hypothetical protein [Aeromonadales bacterium]
MKILLFILLTILNLQFPNSVLAFNSPNKTNELSFIEPRIISLRLTKRQTIRPGDTVVIQLKGTNLQNLTQAFITQQGIKAGEANIEKYSSMHGTQRRLILFLTKKLQSGPLVLTLKSHKKTITLPAQFQLTIYSDNRNY